MRQKRQYQIKQNKEITDKTLEEKLEIFANLIIDRIMEDQQKGIINHEGENSGIQH